MPGEVCLCKPGAFTHALEVGDKLIEAELAVGHRRLPVAAQVVGDHGEVVCETRRDKPPGVSGSADAVDQEKRGAVALDRVLAVDCSGHLAPKQLLS